MPISSFGIIVEGQYDAHFYPALIETILVSKPRIQIRQAGGKSLASKFPGLLHSFKYSIDGGPVERAIVIKDADGRPTGDVESGLSGRVNPEHYGFPRGIQFCAVQQEMETWLLADEGAINEVSLASGKSDGVQRIPDPLLEEVVHAKERFKNALTSGGLIYTTAVCAEIARKINLESLRTRCPSFRRFEQSLV